MLAQFHDFHNRNKVMKLKSVNIATTRYQYSAVAIKTCYWPISKPLKSLFSYINSIHEAMFLCTQWQKTIKLTVDI